MWMLKLTKQQIARQDFVDNEIIETIGTVRDAIRTQIVDKQLIISEEIFYP